MAYKIIASQCTGCSACEFECPNAAISMKGETFIIDPNKCTECEGQYDHPQCDTVCPVPDTCIPAGLVCRLADHDGRRSWRRAGLDGQAHSLP